MITAALATEDLSAFDLASSSSISIFAFSSSLGREEPMRPRLVRKAAAAG